MMPESYVLDQGHARARNMEADSYPAARGCPLSNGVQDGSDPADRSTLTLHCMGILLGAFFNDVTKRTKRVQSRGGRR